MDNYNEQNDVMSIKYRENIEAQLAYDFWFMNDHYYDEWDDNFTWDKNCFPMEWANGWCQLWYDTCRQLLTEVKSNFRIEQLKEKWGYANVYYSGGITPYGREIIKQFEEDSKTICEYCGSSQGIMRTDGWYKCICDKCYKED